MTSNTSTSNFSPVIPQVEITEPGNTFDTAYDFGTFTNGGSNLFAFADAVGGEDGTDLFTFTYSHLQ